MDDQNPEAPGKKKPVRPFTEQRKATQRLRRVRELITMAPVTVARRKCTGKSKVRDAARQPILDKDGLYQLKPCGNWAIKGGSVCPKHGGSSPQVKKAAQRRLLAMVDPALVELEELVVQNGHLPTKLGAIRTVLERAGDEAIGALKQRTEEKNTRPIIKIGIKVGGIANPTVLIGMQAQELPAGDEEVVDGELVVEDDSDTDE